jgi:hypothetical protein
MVVAVRKEMQLWAGQQQGQASAIGCVLYACSSRNVESLAVRLPSFAACFGWQHSQHSQHSIRALYWLMATRYPTYLVGQHARHPHAVPCKNTASPAQASTTGRLPTSVPASSSLSCLSV